MKGRKRRKVKKEKAGKEKKRWKVKKERQGKGKAKRMEGLS